MNNCDTCYWKTCFNISTLTYVCFCEDSEHAGDYIELDSFCEHWKMRYSLSCGIFWVVSEMSDTSNALDNYELLCFNVPCTPDGDVLDNKYGFNSKSGKSFNHEKTWNNLKKSNRLARQYSYRYFPRSRVVVKNRKVHIYLNPIINNQKIIEEISNKFGLYSTKNIHVKIHSDNSEHYHCHWDDFSIT